MKTTQLYYKDCHLSTFEAAVLSCEKAEKGWWVTLDQTAFYPEGGGQPCDLGTLGGAGVLDVREREDAVVHLCDAPLNVGETVTGQLDYARRFTFMQNHSGEHMLSGLICSAFDCSNVGFHMGADCITIDFDREIPMEALTNIERKANELIWQNVPIDCRYPSPEELETIPYRSKKKLEYPVRIVTIPGADCCACCGTHVERTGEIGLIKILSCMRFKGGVRIQILCGTQAFAMTQKIFDQNRLVSQAFSAKLLETGAAAEKMNVVLEQERYAHSQTKGRLFNLLAGQTAGKGNVFLCDSAVGAGDIRLLADKAAEVCGGIAAVIAPREKGLAFCLISRTEDVRPLGKAAAEALGGSGGGKPNMFQGSLSCGQKEAEKFFVGNMNFSAI